MHTVGHLFAIHIRSFSVSSSWLSMATTWVAWQWLCTALPRTQKITSFDSLVSHLTYHYYLTLLTVKVFLIRVIYTFSHSFRLLNFYHLVAHY